MKTIYIILFLIFTISALQPAKLISQICTECICGTTGTGFNEPDSIMGGRFKPARTDIGGATQDEDEFPVLIVFVQFQNEPYSYSTDPGAWNSGQPPNYIDSFSVLAELFS